MSISEVALMQTMTGQLTAQQNSLAQLEEQMASGQALNQPSDNPAAVTQVLSFSAQASQLSSWQSNSELASSWLGTANSTANSVLGSMQTAQSLLLQAANQGVQSATTYEALGNQLKGVVSNLLALSNTQFGGRALFAGTSASAQAYDATGNYLGNSDVPTTVIGPGAGAGQTVGLSVAGTSMFGVGASNVFATLSTAVTALLSGSPSLTQITTASGALASNITTAQQASAVLGESSQQVTSLAATLTTQLASIQTSQANLENVNVATATTQLATKNANYQAVLWATTQTLPETLVKFL